MLCCLLAGLFFVMSTTGGVNLRQVIAELGGGRRGTCCPPADARREGGLLAIEGGRSFDSLEP